MNYSKLYLILAVCVVISIHEGRVNGFYPRRNRNNGKRNIEGIQRNARLILREKSQRQGEYMKVKQIVFLDRKFTPPLQLAEKPYTATTRLLTYIFLMFFHSHFSQLDLKVPVFSVFVISFDCLLMYINLYNFL